MEPLSFTFPKEMVEEIQDLAKEERKTKSQLVRDAVTNYMQEKNGEPFRGNRRLKRGLSESLPNRTLTAWYTNTGGVNLDRCLRYQRLNLGAPLPRRPT